MTYREPTADGYNPGIITLSGDLGGTATSPSVIKINGATISSAGSTSTVLQVSGSNALTYALIADANVSSSAAITISKLAAGTSGQVLLNNATPTPTWTTLSSDVTISATGVTTVNSISGSSPVAITPATLQWIKGANSPTISQATPTSDVATTNLTIQSQAPFASATGSNRNPGNIILNVPSPAAGGAQGFINIQTGGTTGMTFQYDVPNTAATISGATSTNMRLTSASGGSTIIGWTGNDAITGSSNTMSLLAPAATVSWAATVTSPLLRQATATSDVATNNLTIQPQAPFASATTNKNPGNLVLNIPAPISGGSHGSILIQEGGSTVGQWAINSNIGLGTVAVYYGQGAATDNSHWFITGASTQNFLNAGAELGLGIGGTLGGSLDISSTGIQFFARTQSLGGGRAVLGITNATTPPTSAPAAGIVLYSTSQTLGVDASGIQFPAFITSPLINQASTSSGSGTSLTIQAQGATGASNNGGSLILAGGTSGSATAGQVQVNSQFVLKSNILNDGYFAANTQDATANVVIYTDTAIPSGSVYDFVVTVVGVSPGTTNVYRADYSFTYLNNAGTLVAIGAAPVALNVRTNGTGSTFATAIDVSTTSVKVTVTGLAATSIDWAVSFNRTKIS